MSQSTWQASLAGLSDDVAATADWQRVYKRNIVGIKSSALMSSFPSVCAALGEQAFKVVARAYIAQSDDAEANLNLYGSSFAEYVRGYCEDQGLSPHVHSLALYDYALQRAVYAPSYVVDFTLLEAGDVQPDKIVLVANPSLSLFQSTLSPDFLTEGGGQQTEAATMTDVMVVYRQGRIDIEALNERDAFSIAYILAARTLADFLENVVDPDSALGNAIHHQLLIGVQNVESVV